jgi:hypothetical protein
MQQVVPPDATLLFQYRQNKLPNTVNKCAKVNCLRISGLTMTKSLRILIEGTTCYDEVLLGGGG